MPDEPIEGEFTIPSGGEANPAPLPASDPKVAKAAPLPPEKSNPHFFSSFCYYPRGVKLNDQETGEEIILLIRRHFITNVPWIATAIFFAIIGPVLFPFLIRFSPFPLPNEIHLILIAIFYYLIIFGFALLKFTLWYFHIGILTNKRIKDIDIHGILYKDVAETRIEYIQDGKYDQHGFIPSLFNYGNIFIQTAGATPNIEFDRAPQPARIARIILDLIKK